MEEYEPDIEVDLKRIGRSPVFINGKQKFIIGDKYYDFEEGQGGG